MLQSKNPSSEGCEGYGSSKNESKTVFREEKNSEGEFSSVHSLSCVQCFASPWTAACQASLSITNSWSLFKLMSIEVVTPYKYFMLGCPLLLLPSIFPSIRIFSSESALHIRWPKYWSFSFSISPSNECSGLISFRMDCLDLLAVQENFQESSPAPHFKSINSSALSLTDYKWNITFKNCESLLYT